MNQFKSEFNGLEFKAPSAVKTSEEKDILKGQMQATEGGRLFTKATAPVASETSSKSFAMPQNGSVVFAADEAKAKKAANLEKARAAKAVSKGKDEQPAVVE